MSTMLLNDLQSNRLTLGDDFDSETWVAEVVAARRTSVRPWAWVASTLVVASFGSLAAWFWLLP